MFLRQKENIEIFGCCQASHIRNERYTETTTRLNRHRPDLIKASLKHQKRSLRSALSQTQPGKTSLWHSRQPSSPMLTPLNPNSQTDRLFFTHRHTQSERSELKELFNTGAMKSAGGARYKTEGRKRSGVSHHELVIKNKLTTLEGVKESVVSREEPFGVVERVQESVIEMDYFNPGPQHQLQLRRYLSDRQNIRQYITYLMAPIKEALLFTVLTIFALWAAGAFHVIDTGHIGVYKRGGAMLNSWTQPGLHFMLPFITKYHQVQITLQTDQVRDIPCGTSSGVILKFEKIEVVNRLRKDKAHQTIKNYTVAYDQTWIFSKIHHEINQFCSSHTVQEVLIDKFTTLDESLREALQKGCNQWAPGIEIIAVRVTKPTVPDSIAQNYETREVERTKLLIRKEEQRLREKESQIDKILSKIRAQTEQKIESINNKMLLAEKEANKEIALVENQIVVIKEAAKAKSAKYRQQKMIELNKKRLIPQKELANIFTNLKSTQKTIYQSSIKEYLSSAKDLLNKK